MFQRMFKGAPINNDNAAGPHAAFTHDGSSAQYAGAGTALPTCSLSAFSSMAPRKSGETDPQYIKRVVNKMPVPKSLPSAPAKYFNTAGTKSVSTALLGASPSSGGQGLMAFASTAKVMAAAYHGAVDKLDPPKVMAPVKAGGSYAVLGNSAPIAAAKHYGWGTMAVSFAKLGAKYV